MCCHTPLFVIIYPDLFHKAGLQASVHYLGCPFDDIFTGGKLECHREAVIGRFKIWIEGEDMSVLGRRALLELFWGV